MRDVHRNKKELKLHMSICLLLVILVMITLVGCAPEIPPVGETPDPLSTQSTAEPAESDPAAEPSAEDTDVHPLPPDTGEDKIKAYRELLTQSFEDFRFTYAMAMGSVYESPEAMDIGMVFYVWDPKMGFSMRDLSLAEQTFLTENGFNPNCAVQKRPAAELEKRLQYFFDISLSELNDIPDDWKYYPDTDCYYSNTNDAFIVVGYTLTQVEEDGDLIRIHYTVESNDGPYDSALGDHATAAILTLKKYDDGRLVVQSNIRTDR